MGFTTKGEETKKVTYNELISVKRWVEKFAKAQGWDETDVRNRALMYYAYKFREGELDDRMVDQTARINDNIDYK